MILISGGESGGEGEDRVEGRGWTRLRSRGEIEIGWRAGRRIGGGRGRGRVKGGAREIGGRRRARVDGGSE